MIDAIDAIVTGEPRSGTSVMMQILEKIGLDIFWKELSPRALELKGKRRMERAKELNPKGFYEAGNLVIRGTSDEKYIDENLSGKAVKILFPGLGRVPMGKVNKIIYCVRDPRRIMHSQRLLVSNVSVKSIKKDEGVYANEVKEPSFTPYLRRTGRFCFWMNGNDVFWNKTLVVDYDDLLTDTENVLKRICSHLERPYSEDLTECVDSSLYRSKPIEIEQNKELALSIFAATKNRDIALVIKPLRKYFREVRSNRIRWVDDEFKTWVMVTMRSYRSLLKNNNGVRTRLRASVAMRAQKLPFTCKNYNRDGSEYTIKRPGIPDLVRKMVLCKGENRTLEYCFKCRTGGESNV